MDALEFTVQIENGYIKLPEEYKKYSDALARIIVLIDQNDQNHSKKNNLLEVIEKMKDKNMFSTIQDPVEWQKKQRDEW